MIPFLRDLISLGMWVAEFWGFGWLFSKKLTRSLKTQEQRYYRNCIHVHHLSHLFTSLFWDSKSSLILEYGFEFCLVFILTLYAYFVLFMHPCWMFKLILNMASSNCCSKCFFYRILKNITTLPFFRTSNVFMKCLADFWNNNILGYIFLNINIKFFFRVSHTEKMQDETNSTILCLFTKQSCLL